MHEYWVIADTGELPEIRRTGLMFSQDDEANLIGVEVTDDGSPVTLSGTVSANVILQDGTTIQIDGECEDNKAWVVLTDEAYEVVGKIEVFIKLEDDGQVSTLCGVEAYVYKSM